MPDVKCSVANCHYWTEGNNCTADAIMVDVDPQVDRRFNEEIGRETAETNHREYSARRFADTCCHTFRMKERRQ